MNTLSEFPNHNICIGNYAGIDITTECYQLRIKSEKININETMTEREYYLLSETIKVIFENYDKFNIKIPKETIIKSDSLNVSGMKNCDCKQPCNANTCIGRRALYDLSKKTKS